MDISNVSEDYPAVYYAIVLIITLVAIKLIQSTLVSAGKAVGIIRGDTLLLLGGSNAGKTSMYYKLATGSVPQTLTSMKELDTVIQLKGKTAESEEKSVKIVDFPGHPRLRGGLPNFLKRARGIVFVIDSTTVSDNVTPICQYLFEVMTTSSIAAQKLPLLIACNKSDLGSSSSLAKIKSTLETELDQLIDTTGSLEDTGDEDEGIITLKRSGEKFKFDSDATCKITFTACSAMKGDGISDVESFMRSTM
jgi:signal recognition particle receptor subunit beta